MEGTEKKRTRKKSCQIDSLEKLKNSSLGKKDDTLIENIAKTTKQEKKKSTKELNQSHISFGRFNATIKKSTQQMSPDELKEYYEKKFNISENDSKLITQDLQNDLIPEPMTEEEYKVGIDKPVINDKKNREIYEILHEFKDTIKQIWPKSTNIHCWHCTYQFNTTPLPCPVEYDELKKKFKVNGVFCSWGCVARYSIDNYKSLSLVNIFRNQVVKKTNSDEPLDIIPIAPSRFVLEKFGGPFKIDKFRTSNNNQFIISTETISYVNQEIIEFKF
jgi:hypothetical protein